MAQSSPPRISAPIEWQSGLAMKRQLAAPIGVQWSGVPLRAALMNLARSQRVAILVDRRVDPDQRLDLAVQNQPVKDVLRDVAASQELGMTLVGSVVYFGPATYTSQLRTVCELRAEEIRALAPTAMRKWLSMEPLVWDDFATPREVLSNLAAKAGIRIVGLEQVPHDLWPATDLPLLTLADRLTLILGQFGLAFQAAPDGNSISLSPLPARAALVRSYPGGSQPKLLAEKWAEAAPQCEFKISGGRIYVRGRLEDHEEIAALLHPTSRPPGQTPSRSEPKPVAKGKSPPGEIRYTVRQATSSLGSLLRQVSRQAQLSLKIDEAGLQQAGISLQQQVSFSVENATLDELLTAILQSTGCTFRRQGQTLEIIAAEK